MVILGGWVFLMSEVLDLEKMHVLPGDPEAGSYIEQLQVHSRPRKVDVRLPGKGSSNSHGAGPVHLIITMINLIRTSRWSIKNCHRNFPSEKVGLTLNPNTPTPNPKPQTPNSKPQTSNPKPQTPNPKLQTPNSKP